MIEWWFLDEVRIPCKGVIKIWGFSAGAGADEEDRLIWEFPNRQLDIINRWDDKEK